MIIWYGLCSFSNLLLFYILKSKYNYTISFFLFLSSIYSLLSLLFITPFYGVTHTQLNILKQIFVYFILWIYVCMSKYMYVHYVHAHQKRHWVIQNWSYWATIWVLRTKPRSSRRVASSITTQLSLQPHWR